MKPKQLKNLLMSKIHNVANNSNLYCMNPEKDFTRKRKLTMEKLIVGIIGMESGSLSNELIDFFNTSADTPTASAFCQQRCKINPDAFQTVFCRFSQEILDSFKDDLPVLAVDGSKIQIPINPEDTDSFFPGANGQKPYNLTEMITSHVVIDQKQRKYTYKANFSVAVHMCRLFYHGRTTSPGLETIIARNLVPIRPDRHRERKLSGKIFHGFLYRVA